MSFRWLQTGLSETSHAALRHPKDMRAYAATLTEQGLVQKGRRQENDCQGALTSLLWKPIVKRFFLLPLQGRIGIVLILCISIPLRLVRAVSR